MDKGSADLDVAISLDEFKVICMKQESILTSLTGVEWVHGLFLFPVVLGKM